MTESSLQFPTFSTPSQPGAPKNKNGPRQPKYCRQKRRYGDLAFVTIHGKRHYLGNYNSPESIEAYHRLLAEIAMNGGRMPVSVKGITVVEVAQRFVTHARTYYRKEGKMTAEPGNIILAFKPLIELYGRTPAAEFGPKGLKAVRQRMVDRKVTRRYINRHIERIKRMFKWAVAEELVPPSSYHALQAVAGLRFGRTEAPEPDPVRPVPEELIEPVKQLCSRQVAAIIDIQLLTGARPGEVLIMRPIDFDMSNDVWIYTPARHKTQHHGHVRTIPIGPKAQEVLRPFLTHRPIHAYLFSPEEAEAERYAEQHKLRVTPLSCGNRPRKRRDDRPARKLGDHYDRTSYTRAIARACEQAFPLPEDLAPPLTSSGKPMPLRDFIKIVNPAKAAAIRQWRREHHWHPHQLRHNYATNIRREHGLELAQILLGHAKADVTQIYAERDLKRAIEVARKIG